jgi:hypothetical protein
MRNLMYFTIQTRANILTVHSLPPGAALKTRQHLFWTQALDFASTRSTAVRSDQDDTGGGAQTLWPIS